MNYYEKHLGDYAKDAGHLSILEHGVYNLLMDRYYSTEQGIPNDDRYRKIRANSEDERAAVDVVLREFFTLDEDDVWRKGRIEEEIAKARKRMETARANGLKGGRPSVATPQDSQQKPSGLPEGSDQLTGRKALHTPDTSTSSPIGEEDKRGKRARKRSAEVVGLWLTAEQMRAGNDDLSQEVAEQYLAFRKAKKAPLTDLAWRDIVKEVRKIARPLDRALPYAMNRNWQGFDATWVPGYKGAGAQQPEGGRAGRAAAALSDLDDIIRDGMPSAPQGDQHGPGDDFIDVPSRILP